MSATTEAGRRRGTGMRLRLLAAGAALVALSAFGGLVWYAYLVGTGGGADGVVPTLAADPSPLKRRPDEPGGLQLPNTDKQVYGQIGQTAPPPAVERVQPPPEVPLPRPVAAAPPKAEQAMAPPPIPAPAPTLDPLVEAILQGRNAPAAGPAPAPSVAPATKPAVAPAPAQAQAQPPKPAAAPVQTAALPGGWRVQLASVGSEEMAQQELARLRKRHADLLGGLGGGILPAEVPNRGTFYRVQVGPLASRDAAVALCGTLKARKTDCLVLGP